MATGPDHYREAERLVRVSQGQETEFAALTIATAQVHATLALAAATALQPIEGMAADPDWQGWLDVASEARKTPAAADVVDHAKQEARR